MGPCSSPLIPRNFTPLRTSSYKGPDGLQLISTPTSTVSEMRRLLDSLLTEVHLAVAELVKCTAPPNWSCCIRSQHKRCPNESRCCFHKNSSPHSDELLSGPRWFLNTQWFCSFSRDALSPEVFRWDPCLHLGLYQNVPFPNIFRMFYLKFQLLTAQVFQSPFLLSR